MKEKTLLRIALALSLAGIITLIILSQEIDIDQPAIDKLDEMIDESVVATGMVLDVAGYDGVTFIRIQRDEIIEVTLFGDTPPLSIGDLIQVRGKVSEEDDGSTSIIGDEIRVI